jgi:hypothetical protein
MFLIKVFPILFAAAVLIFVIVSVVYTFNACGWKTLVLGNGGPAAAMLGMCDE